MDIVKEKEKIKELKKILLEKSFLNTTGHVPSSLSCVEILYLIYNKFANITKENAPDTLRDRVIISKEHARLTQVCTLYQKVLKILVQLLKI